MAVKITDMPAASGLSSDDLFEITNDPSGTPQSQKLTGSQLNAGLSLADLNDVSGADYTSGSFLIGDGSDSFDQYVISGEGTISSAGVFDLTYWKIDNTLNNVHIGNSAGAAITTGTFNIFIGTEAGLAQTEAARNVCIGRQAGKALTTGGENFALGEGSLLNATTSGQNVCIGRSAGAGITTATVGGNIHIGRLVGGGTGNLRNVLIGSTCGSAVTGQKNIGLGYQTFNVATSADSNVAIGYAAGVGLTTGDNNILMGYQAGDNITTGSNKIVIGSDIDAQSATTSNTISIANLIMCENHGAKTGTTLSTGNIGIGVASPTTSLQTHGAIRPATYTVASITAASTVGAGAIAYVSNGAAGNPVLAFSNGTNWLRCDTLATISAT